MEVDVVVELHLNALVAVFGIDKYDRKNKRSY
jgi:hypothetical protein